MSEDLIDNKIKPWGPTEDGENFDILIKHLDEVIIDGTATNIGVIGPYGSGKSSFIETFLKKKKRTDSVIRISLASFNTEHTDKRALEVGIVQQILYHFDPEKTPLSRFHRIVSPKFNQFIWIFITTLYPILFYFGFTNYLIIDSFLQKYIYLFFNILYCSFLTYWYIKSIYILAYFLLIYSLGYICWTLYTTIVNWRTISIASPIIGSIGIENYQAPQHILDEHLEEILYVFDANPQKRIVIFEDMDRFNDTITIFTKLREINHLLNNRGKKPIIFIYAIRENLIPKPEYRVKFFNFIIPIIPYSDQNNSESRLKKIFSVKEELLIILSDYIYDTRLMQHLYNEYTFYFNTLKKESFAEFNPNKLLAMIAYKNLYPYDFEDIRQKKGYLYTATKIGINSSIGDFKTNITNLPNSEEEHGFKTIIRQEALVPKDHPEVENTQLDFIYSLLSNEYISDDYDNYLSHFIPGSISATDRQFIQKVRALSVDKKQWGQNLDKVENVISKLTLYFFARYSILNYDLLFILIKITWDDETQEFTSRETLLKDKFDKIIGLLKSSDLGVDKDKPELVQEFIDGLLGPNGVQKHPNLIEPLRHLILKYDFQFNKIPERTPDELLKEIVRTNQYTLNEMNLKQIYDLSLKSLWDMSYYWEKAKELSEDTANKALENIITTINNNELSPTPQEQVAGYPVVDYVPMLKEIILQPSLYNLSFIDSLNDNKIEIKYNGDYVENLQNLSSNRIKVLIENDMIAVELFTSISTNNKTLSDDEKIKLWNIYIEKDRDLVQKELTTPIIDIIFPDWGILKKGNSFMINNTEDNLNFCKFLKENKSISSYYNYRKGEPIKVNRTKYKLI